VTKAVITLPGHLRRIFSKIYEDASAANGWATWQKILEADPGHSQFQKRLATIQLACKVLRDQVKEIQKTPIDISDDIIHMWVQSIDRLTTLTIPINICHPKWKENASKSDVVSLEGIHVYYQLRKLIIEVDPEEIKKLVDQILTLIDLVNKSGLDTKSKQFFCSVLNELNFFLQKIELLGIEGAWGESGNLAAGLLRFDHQLQSEPTLREHLRTTAVNVMHYLAVIGGAADGAALIAHAAQGLLGATPAF
jgi:hypothetical protein